MNERVELVQLRLPGISEEKLQRNSLEDFQTGGRRSPWPLEVKRWGLFASYCRLSDGQKKEVSGNGILPPMPEKAGS